MWNKCKNLNISCGILQYHAHLDLTNDDFLALRSGHGFVEPLILEVYMFTDKNRSITWVGSFGEEDREKTCQLFKTNGIGYIEKGHLERVFSGEHLLVSSWLLGVLKQVVVVSDGLLITINVKTAKGDVDSVFALREPLESWGRSEWYDSSRRRAVRF